MEELVARFVEWLRAQPGVDQVQRVEEPPGFAAEALPAGLPGHEFVGFYLAAADAPSDWMPVSVEFSVTE